MPRLPRTQKPISVPALALPALALPALAIAALQIAAPQIAQAQPAQAQHAQSGMTQTPSFRPPAVPLVTHDPYFSIWSMTNELPGGTTRHWTEKPQALTSLIRVDGKTYQLMGAPVGGALAMTQKSVEVFPTRTVYTFVSDALQVTLTFTSPFLPDDLEVFTRPATYVTWEAKSLDGKTHDASVYFDASGMLAVNDADQMVVGTETKGALNSASLSARDQMVLGRSGDDLRIEWGHLLLGVPAGAANGSGTVNQNLGTRNVQEFVTNGGLAKIQDRMMGHRPDAYVTAAAIGLGKVGAASVKRHAILAYDDEFSIQYFGHNLRPYWRRKGADAKGLLAAAERDYTSVMARCVKFDTELMADLTKAGGVDYARLGALAYRQSFAAQKVVADPNGQPLMFSKENNSNGCIATVDIMYPEFPQLVLFSPTLAKASLQPILDYSSSPRWKWPFAPHDLGQYPLANGQVYGGGERSEENQMPVEETGNMLIMLAALAKSEGNAEFSRPHWPLLKKWAAYLADKGFDPESQLSTDDFAGHLAHNVNLSVKAIEALGAYSQLATMLGDTAEATKSRTLAQGFSDRWVKEAADGDHTRLAFDKPGTWAQKYNLVWDRILGIDLFPQSVATSETAYYRTKFNPYGLPLDSRRDYTKLDWTVWTATLTGKRDDFDAIIAPTLRYLDETPDRVPMNDWHRTEVARKEGFKARSVVGGVFIKLLDDKATWDKWVRRDTLKVGGWAPLPKPPIVTDVVPTSEKTPAIWSYSFTEPVGDWATPGYDVSAWKTGPAGFGSSRNPNTLSRTDWVSDDIWIRRDFDLTDAALKSIVSGTARLSVFHDDDAEVYVNGVLVARLPGATGQYEMLPMLSAAKSAFRKGRNVLAIHVKETGGDQYIDAGFTTVVYPK